MNKNVDNWINENKDRLIEAFRQNIRLRSVESEAAPGAPFGEGVLASLTHALDVCAKLGFATKNLDGYAGWAEYGEGDETLGIMVHLDVVPEGEGWKYPPYSAELIDGNIYGRGALDDKGPAFSTIFALAAVKECGLKMRRKVRIIFGCDEESGWQCIAHYKKKEKLPELAFSPDAEYPVVNSEKGIYHATFKNLFPSSITLEAGTVVNAVPGKAKLTLPVGAEEINRAIKSLPQDGFTYIAADNAVTVEGQAAHASTPEQGKNALMAAIRLICALDLPETEKRAAAELFSAFKFDNNGESVGLKISDESGALTLNPGIIKWTEKGIEKFMLDIRYPISSDPLKLDANLKAGLSSFEFVESGAKAGHFVPESSELVSKLLDVYAERSGERLPPIKIGGGTYARAMETAVAFGCERPGSQAPIHMPNEFISVDDMLYNTYMLADAIIALSASE